MIITYTLVDCKSDFKKLIDVPINKRGFPPHYIDYIGYRCVRRGNRIEGHYYEVLDSKTNDALYHARIKE